MDDDLSAFCTLEASCYLNLITMRTKTLFFILSMVIFSISCGRKTAPETSTPLPPPVTDQPPSMQPDDGAVQEGKVWTLMSYGPANSLQLVPSGVSVTLQMDIVRDAISGNGGCNRYTGSLASTNSGYRINNIAATSMACPGPAMEVEDVFFRDLRKVTSYAFQGGRLIMNVEGGRQLVFYSN